MPSSVFTNDPSGGVSPQQVVDPNMAFATNAATSNVLKGFSAIADDTALKQRKAETEGQWKTAQNQQNMATIQQGIQGANRTVQNALMMKKRQEFQAEQAKAHRGWLSDQSDIQSSERTLSDFTLSFKDTFGADEAPRRALMEAQSLAQMESMLGHYNMMQRFQEDNSIQSLISNLDLGSSAPGPALSTVPTPSATPSTFKLSSEMGVSP